MINATPQNVPIGSRIMVSTIELDMEEFIVEQWGKEGNCIKLKKTGFFGWLNCLNGWHRIDEIGILDVTLPW